MRRATSIACLMFSLLLTNACDEPDHWEAKTDNRSGSNGTTTNRPGIVGGSGTRAATVGSVVNAPVAPEAIYVGLGGAASGVSVIDLNGFGQGTGDINNTRFPLNPNIGAPGVVPPLAPGTSNLDAGSAGVLTLTQNVNGGTRLIDGAVVGEVIDLQIGQPLDLVFNNFNVNLNASPTNQVNPATGTTMAGNTFMVAPHPNPPRLVFPPPNPAMGIEAEEPTVVSTQGVSYPFTPTSPPCLPSPLNLLVQGNPFSSQIGVLGIFGASFPGAFYGPQPPPPSPPPPLPFCPYVSRQQIGHFLYVLDRVTGQVVVVNSNRFTVLATIAMPDPTDMAMSPNLELLAVGNSSTGDVRFIDTNPLSANFHRVVAQTQLTPGITELAWQPEGEDLLVVNPRNNSLTLIDGLALRTRRVLTRELRGPMGVAVGARQTSFGFQTGVWHAFVLNRDGSVAVFESGPAGVNGIGYDDVIGTIGPRFRDARSIHADFALGAGFWVTHVDAEGLGQVSRVELVGAPLGPQALLPAPPVAGDATQLPFRGKIWRVTQRFGGVNSTTPIRPLLSGDAVVDLAFDDILNQGAWPDQRSNVVPGLRYANHSGKGVVKLRSGAPTAARSPLLMFVALADVGRVDVLDLSTGNRIVSIAAPGIRALCDYWRQ